MTHWIETYPHDVYASVLLLDGRIYNYKIGQNHWDHPLKVKMYLSDFDKIDRMEVKNTYWTVQDGDEHQLVFEKWAKDWFKQWEVHEDVLGSRPY